MNGKWTLLNLVLSVGAFYGSAFRATAAPVRLTETQITIPTYLVGDPEPNPIFYTGRGSQGAQGRVYPYPLYDTLTNVKSNKTYRIIYLENEYVRLGILPEIGGRLFEAIDKTDGYDFVYRQHVIKPALIGLIGAWISGGVEWNIPHHHRATTALPVQYRCTDNPDGSKTVWVGELELRHRMRWAVGYTLHPGRSYLECSVRILNRTPYANSMLCFANVAVHVNDDYQVIYPPHTQFVTFHGKHEFTTWPIATTKYAGADFTRGVDVSWYSNHISANSMFAWNYQDDFFAGYDHGKHAGIISFADHHIVPGKKFWTWGNGPRGRMWDKILTDSDGPYIELMVGGYSDNQPDYSWLQPYETKSFEMYWYPFRQIDGLKNANLDAAVNLEVGSDRVAHLGFCTTAAHKSATVLLQAGTHVVVKENISIDPSTPYVRREPLPAGVQEADLHAALIENGKELIGYTPVHLEPAKMPEPVQDPPAPKEIKTIEELYLAGQRIEQFHSPNLQPEPYWEEALRRDPDDARVNTALGIRLLKQSKFGESEDHLRRAVARLTRNYTAPKDGEAFYYLGLARQGEGWLESSCSSSNYDAACDAFYKATWSQAWRSPAYFALAELASLRGDDTGALKYVEHSLEANSLSVRAWILKAALLRHAGKADQARNARESAQKMTDPQDVSLAAERWLAGERKAAVELVSVMRDFPATAVESAVDYARAGLWHDGISILELMVRSENAHQQSPLALYYLGEFEERLGSATKAAEYRRRAAQASPDYAFPFQWEAIPALRHAMEHDPKDARAPYYLGNLLFDWQPNSAVKYWEQSASLDPSFAIVHRNLGLAYSLQSAADSKARGIAELEKAVAAPKKYALHFAELDELYASTGADPEKRLALLEQNQAVVSKRDDALSHEIGLLVFEGKYDLAIQFMTGRRFSVWEGGSLEVAQHWVNAHVLRGRAELSAGNVGAALTDFKGANMIPDNLPNDAEGNSRAPEFSYWLGLTYEQMGNTNRATEAWREATKQSETNLREGRVSERHVQAYFGALARQKLGQHTEAETSLNALLDSARKTLEKQETPERARGRKRHLSEQALAHYVAGLGHLGLGQSDEARNELRLALEASPDLLGAKTELAAMH